MTKVYFRADGNSSIGLGHIYRSLALANMLKQDFDCYFMVRAPLQNIKSKIKAAAQLIELKDTNDAVGEAKIIAEKYLKGAEIVVLDGYHFKTDYQQIIRNAGVKLVCIDDIYACHFLADAIINHAGGILPSHYDTASYTNFYLGPNYLLLRDEFVASAQKPYSKTNNMNIFLCMGGGDINNYTLNVLQQVAKRTKGEKATYFVLIGEAYLYKTELDAFIKKSELDVVLLSSLSAHEIIDYMQRCSIAICPPSTISFEYLCTGGALYLYQIADNQKNIRKYLLEEALAFDFKENFPVEDALIRKTVKYQKTVIDGNSPIRLLDIFKQLSEY